MERYKDRIGETDECKDCGREIEDGEELCKRCLDDYGDGVGYINYQWGVVMEEDNKDIKFYYGVMNECKSYIHDLQSRKIPLDSTVKQYRSHVKRMVKNNSDPIQLAKTRNSFYAYRAAWCYIYEQQAREYLSKAKKENDHQKKILLIKKLQYCVSCIQKIPADFKGENLKKSEMGDYVSLWKDAKKPTLKSKSKKTQISKLPKNWNEKYFSYLLEKQSCYCLSVAVLKLSGCRPFELMGVGVKLSIKDDGINFTINSAKSHGDKYGQGVRSFTIKSDSLEYKYLFDYIKKGGSSVSIKSSKNLGEQMRKYSVDVFPSLNSYISPYTFRHSFASYAKRILTDEQTAIVMGHCNDVSQTFYSNSKKDVSGFSISSIIGSKKVRLVTKNNMNFDSSSLSLSM